MENARLHEESARLLEEVQQLHRTRERFFAMVNHELRNSLAAVYGWAEMMVRKKDPATVPQAAFEVLDSAQQAVGLINDLLDLSRLDEDRLKPVIRAIEPAPWSRRALARVTPAAEAKRVPLQLDVRAGSAELRDRRQPGRADPGQPAGQRDPALARTAAPSASQVTGQATDGGLHGGGRGTRDRSRARSSGSSTSTSPRTEGDAGASGWGCRSPGGLPGCWAGSCGRVARPATAGCFVLELPASAAIMKKAS